ncbi:MAG: hypothetical protein QMC36_08125 [Patescibacteria group bacterium]
MTAKKPTIAARPAISKETMAFIEGASQETAGKGEAPAKKEKEKKVQIPLLVPPSLVSELDASIERSGTGISRSAWICQAIRERLDAGK